ncbi:thiamine transport system ATP-binding protein [Devosia subaequoris]|uniref:Thiamine transport system ATP-binding protein n=1 Tax=Devosia subaequoris TaxID=395930 RepID=A0A7W6INB1_9HYPH|nr:ATP-binding cassette domain-containing protein [Devosia subaequoris]MBB4052725.1 thiamine transport system ATP-binding protein [Devosia subaequoris]MCP1209878.1 ATP-binding cassette domain-containing protein [Devosia subaequoris]
MLRADDLVFAHPGQGKPYGFSLEAKPGEVTAISGASGSGKSTLLDLMAGFIAPVSGSLTLDGQELLPFPPEARPVSLLLQADNLFEHLSAEENVVLGLPRGTPRSAGHQQVAEALAEVGLTRFEAKQAANLSGGQKQRVALARTLLRNRPVLLLDEPFSALDDETRQTTRELVGELTRRHKWHTVLVSHHADDIAALATTHYRITAGKLERV